MLVQLFGFACTLKVKTHLEYLGKTSNYWEKSSWQTLNKTIISEKQMMEQGS